MELHEANRILRSVKAAICADGVKLPPSADTDGLMMLLDKLDPEKFLAQKIKHARSYPVGSSAYNRAYSHIAFFRALSAVKNGMTDPVTSVSVMLLHKSVCGDLDPEAGKPRIGDVSTAGSAHTDAKYIPGSLKAIITKMNDIESAPEIGKEDFAGYLTHYMRELIIMHPFDNGSEFTVRLFMMLFCQLKGFALCFYRSPARQIKEAEQTAFQTDDITPLYKVLFNCLSYENTVSSEPTRPPIPKTRRELASKAQKITPGASSEQKIASVKMKAFEDKKAEQQNSNKDDVLKRAIKLQQKITKLNEQLTELMNQSSNNDSKTK